MDATEHPTGIPKPRSQPASDLRKQGQVDPDNFLHTFPKLAERADLGHWHPHDLRHSGASLIPAQGTPLHMVSEISGHTTLAITKDVHGHLPADEKLAAEAMSGPLSGA